MAKSNLTSVALAVAAGQSIAAWCRENNVSMRHGYRLSKSPECLKLVQDIRRRAVDRAVGRLARHAAKAVGQIVKLSEGAESEAVRLSAARAVLAELLAVQGHAELDKRMSDIEAKLSEQSRKSAGKS